MGRVLLLKPKKMSFASTNIKRKPRGIISSTKLRQLPVMELNTAGQPYLGVNVESTEFYQFTEMEVSNTETWQWCANIESTEFNELAKMETDDTEHACFGGTKYDTVSDQELLKQVTNFCSNVKSEKLHSSSDVEYSNVTNVSNLELWCDLAAFRAQRRAQLRRALRHNLGTSHPTPLRRVF